jgi:hypothetical protein
MKLSQIITCIRKLKEIPKNHPKNRSRTMRNQNP